MAATALNCLGATVAFATSSFTAQITGISLDGIEREAHDTSHLGLTVYDTGVSAYRTKTPGALIEPPQITIDCLFSGDFADPPPTSKVAEVITLSFAGSGSTSDGTIAWAEGFIVSGPTITGGEDDVWKGSVTVQLSGDPTWTDPV